MSRDHLPHSIDDEQDSYEAINDDSYPAEQDERPRHLSRADTLRARRRVESLLEERRLRRAIEDDWRLDDDEE